MLEEKELFEWVKAIIGNEITNSEEGEYMNLRVEGIPDTGFYRDDKGMYDTNIHGLQSLESIEWLKPIQSSLKEEKPDINKINANSTAQEMADVVTSTLINSIQVQLDEQSSLTPKSIIGVFVKYSERKPSVNGEYLCRFLTHLPVGLRAAEYLQYDKEEGGFMVEHNDYAKLEWFDDELMLSPKSIRDSDGWISVEDGVPKWNDMFSVNILGLGEDGRMEVGSLFKQSTGTYSLYHLRAENYIRIVTHWQPLPAPPNEKSASLKPNKLSDSKVIWKDAELSPNVKVTISSLPFPTSIEEYETVIANLIEAIPSQTNDHDWWPDSLTDAVNEANKLLENKKSRSD